LNIGIVTVWFDRGAAYVSKAYLDVLSPHHNIYVYARGGEVYAKGDENWDKSYVTWGRRLRLGIPTLIAWNDFKGWIFKNKLDTIIFNEQHSWDAILRTINLGIKIGSYIDYYTKETVPFFDLYDFILCNTQRHYSVFKGHPQSLYLPWGSDCNVYTGNCEPVSRDSVVFFHSCGMSPRRKGTDILVRAFLEVKGAGKLIIHSQLPLNNPVLSDLIRRDSRISLIVKTVGPPGLYHLGDVYVYPTRLEGIGLTIAEALACGLPVITVDNAPMNEFVIDGINGRLVSVIHYKRRDDHYYWDEGICSEQSLTQAMQFYVNHQQGLREFKVAARNYALKYLDWTKNTWGLSNFISESRMLIKPKRLIRAAAFYEYTRFPGLMTSALFRKLGSFLFRS
jgi:1,2-diacylglycerol 3-alpha-glucosyltransferase